MLRLGFVGFNKMKLDHPFHSTLHRLRDSPSFEHHNVPARIKVCTLADGVMALSFNAEQVAGFIDWPWRYEDGLFCSAWKPNSGFFVARWTMERIVQKVGVDDGLADLGDGANTVLFHMRCLDHETVDAQVCFGIRADGKFVRSDLQADNKVFDVYGAHDLGFHMDAIIGKKVSKLTSGAA